MAQRATKLKIHSDFDTVRWGKDRVITCSPDSLGLCEQNMAAVLPTAIKVMQFLQNKIRHLSELKLLIWMSLVL